MCLDEKTNVRHFHVMLHKMSNQTKYTRKALNVFPDIGVTFIDNQIEVMNGISIVAATEIQTGNFVVKNHYSVGIPIIGILIN